METTGFRDTATGPDGVPLVILRTDGSLEIQKPGEGGPYESVKRVEAGKEAGGGAVSLSPGGKLLLLQFGSTAVIYATESLKELSRFQWPGPRGAVQSSTFSPDNRRVAFAYADHTIGLRDIASGQETALVTGDDSRHASISLSADGRWLACSSFSGGARLWDLTASPPRLCFTSPSHDVSWSVEFTPDSRRLVVGLDTGDLAFWDVVTGACVLNFRNQGIPAIHLLFDPADHTLVTLSSNRVIRRSVTPGFVPPRPPGPIH
jgi:WD40 repeat protein